MSELVHSSDRSASSCRKVRCTHDLLRRHRSNNAAKTMDTLYILRWIGDPLDPRAWESGSYGDRGDVFYLSCMGKAHQHYLRSNQHLRHSASHLPSLPCNEVRKAWTILQNSPKMPLLFME